MMIKSKMNPFTAKEIVRHSLVILTLAVLPADVVVFVAMLLYVFGVGLRYREHLEIEAEKEMLQKENAATNWAQILGVSSDASLQECHRVKRLLTDIYHPKYGQAPNVLAYQRVKLAFEIRKKGV